VAPLLWGLTATFESGQLAAIERAQSSFWLALAYMTIASSIGAYGLWYYLIKHVDVTQAAPFLLLEPLIAVAAGVLVMGDELTWSKIVGGSLILGGVGLITVRDIVRTRRVRRALAAVA